MRSSILYHHHAAPAFIAAFVICMLGGLQASAQQFQFVYGGPECREAGRYGVKQLNAGDGYISVGETFSTGAPCGPSDAYVVRTDRNGGVVWAFSYEIGGNDSATDVVEEATGNFVVCGVTDNGISCPSARDIFIMRLNPNGVVLGANTFGSPDAASDELAWNIVQLVDGTGDFVLAGSTTFNSGLGRDPYLLRIFNNLNLRWDARYGGPTTMDEIFYGVDVIQTDGTGDIVAVGTTNTVTFGGYDVLMARVDPNSGGMFSPVQNIAIYGKGGNDEGRAIIEVRSGPFTGDLVVTGITGSRPAPSFNLEVLMLQTGRNPCDFVADQYAGDDAEGFDGGVDLKEDMFSTTPTGDVIVTGFTDFGDFGASIPPNVFLQRFALGTMAPAGSAMWYGGNALDVGWSVNNVQAIGLATPGYIISGLTTSPNRIGADPEQMYLIKTNTAFMSGCNEKKFDFIREPINLDSGCAKVVPVAIALECRPEVRKLPLTKHSPLCVTPVQTRERGSNGNDGVSGVESPAVISFNEGSVTSYPNPLTSGEKLNLRFDMKGATTAHISVSDIMGRVMHERDVNVATGSATHAIETEGWTSGSYLVRVEIGGRALTTRVAVIER